MQVVRGPSKSVTFSAEERLITFSRFAEYSIQVVGTLNNANKTQVIASFNVYQTS